MEKAAPSVSSGYSKAKARDYNDIAQGRDTIFLGFTIKGKKIRWSDKALADFKHRIKELTGRSWGVFMEYRLHKLGQYFRGWIARTLASASTTGPSPNWTSGSDGACACATGQCGGWELETPGYPIRRHCVAVPGCRPERKAALMSLGRLVTPLTTPGPPWCQ